MHHSHTTQVNPIYPSPTMSLFLIFYQMLDSYFDVFVCEVWLKLKRIKDVLLRALHDRGSCPVSRAPEGGQAATMQTIYFYMIKRNCASVSTYHRSEVKLPQHRKRTVIHPSCPPYTKKDQRVSQLQTIDLHVIKCLCSTGYRHRGFRLNKLNVADKRLNAKLLLAHMYYTCCTICHAACEIQDEQFV